MISLSTIKTILASVLLLMSLTACGLLGGNDEPGIPGKIVFSAKMEENGNSHIFTMNADGTGLRQLTFWDSHSVDPTWSPDGRRIAFATSHQATTLGRSLYIMDADGSNKRPLKKFPYESPRVLFGSEPDWSPDGKKIAFQFCTNCEGGGSNYQIAVVDVEGEEYDSTQIQTITSYSGSDTNPRWSPDGSRIAFTSARASPSDIYIIDYPGGQLKRLTQTGNAGRHNWYPAGNKILYWSKNELHTKDLENKESTLISVPIDDEMGFRPLALAFKNKKYILLHVFNYANPRDKQSLSILNPNNNKLITIYSNHVISSGADWHIDKK